MKFAINSNAFVVIIFLLLNSVCFAQEIATKSETTMVYKDFVPAEITLQNGKIVKEQKANIFLKNGALLYKYGLVTKQANMKNISSVKFNDNEYIRIDSLLACIVDSVNGHKILCASLIDMESLNHQLQNQTQLTSLEISNYVNTTTISEATDGEIFYPLANHFFYKIGGTFVKVNERALKKYLPKDKHRLLKTIINSPDFDWENIECLKLILSKM